MVTLETFFEKFDLFADTPGAVAKMRDLVRHLAVTGKLVGQDPSEESGELLLKKTSAERLAAVKAGQLSPMRPLPVVGQDELSFKLQPGWATARLIELVMEIQTGPFGSSLHKRDYQLGGTPVINPASLKDGKIVPIDAMAIGHTTLERLEVFKLCAGDIVMARRGEMGRCAIVTKNEEGWLCGTGSLVLRMPRSLYAPYLAMMIGAPMARNYLSGASVGTTMQNLKQSILAKMPVGVPPLAEQKRIVAKVDELMALCDRLEAQQQEREKQHAALASASLARFADAPTSASLDFFFHSSFSIQTSDLRKSILTLAVQGKLVPQDPNDEPAEELIARIATVRLAKKAKQYEPVSADEVPYEVPLSWAWVRLGNISLASNSGWSPRCLPEARSGTDWGVLKVSAVSWGVFKPDENKALPPGMTGRPNCEVKAGDFLLSRANTEELVARSVVVDQTPPRLMMSDKIVRFTFPDEIERAFINLANTSEPSRAYYSRNASGTSSSMKNIGREVMCNLPVPLPPLAEQRRIVAKVDQLMALLDQLEAQLTASRTTAANLLSALVAELTAA